MKKLLIPLMLLYLSLPAYATLTPGTVPVTKTGGTSPVVQDSLISQSGSVVSVNGSVSTQTSNTPQIQFYPTVAGDSHYVCGTNGNGNGSNDDHWICSEGTTFGSSIRIDLAPGGLITFTTMSVGATTFTGDVTLSTHNLISDTTTGSQIFTSSSQKGGFFGATPIVRPTGNVCTALQNLGLVASCTESGGAGTGTINQVAYFSGTNTVSGSANFLWDGKAFQLNAPNSTYLDATAGNGQAIIKGNDATEFTVYDTAAYDPAGGAAMIITADAGSAMTSGNRLGKLAFSGAPDANHATNSSQTVILGAFAEENFTTSNMGTQFRLKTTKKLSNSSVTAMIVTGNGNWESSGTAPTVSSCGSSPSVTSLSTNNSGSVTVGSGVTTSCLITFANSGWVNAPNCVANDDSSIVAIKAVATTTTLTLSSSAITSDKLTWICQGNE